MIETYGTGRVIEPVGVLPQPAAKLDATGPVRPDEFEIAVDRLCLDATSFRQVRSSCDADPERMAERVLKIVRERGKMHNPVTDSGGVATGTVTAVGPGYTDPPGVGDRIVTLASLSLTPLLLEEVVEVDPDSAQIRVRGTAWVFNSAPWGPLPNDLPLETALAIYDVYGAGSHVARMASPGDTVCVMGAGHAGKLAMAAAREVTGGGTVVAIDADRDAIGLATDLGLCDIGLTADLRDPVGVRDRLVAAGAPEADLTVVVVSSTGCESAAILATAVGGTVLFFSMATSFQAAALTADGIGRDVRMLIGSGFTPDCGAWSLDLVRRSGPLRQAFGLEPVIGGPS